MANSSNLAFCLEYSNHKSDMMDAFDDYLRSESMVDVMLSCEGNTIKAHKMVLSAGSTYFRNIFSAFKNPFHFPVLIIKDMPFRDLKAIVQFLYRGEVVVPVEQVSSLSKSAQTLYIKGLEKYFNKSAMVNVANHSAGANTDSKTSKTANTSSHTSLNTSKPKSKPTNTCPKRSISMSLRQTHRPDYRQLSNGDFISGDEIDLSESEDIPNQVITIGKPVTHVTYGRRNQNQMTRAIKSEVTYFENYDMSEDNPMDGPLLGSDPNRLEDSIEDENEYELDVFGSDEQTEESGVQHQPSTSKSGAFVSSEPRGLIKNPVQITPRRVKTPFVGRNKKRKASNKRNSALNQTQRPNLVAHEDSEDLMSGQIKSDPDRLELISCSLCPRVFSQTSSLTIHMKRIHADDNKEHICHLCGKKYSWRSGLYKHMRTHRNR